ncbi:MAG: hypothetical protein ACRC4T_12795 [Cetobacterium sp.]
MTKERIYKFIILSIILSFLGFICSVSNSGRLPLKKIGEIVRIGTFLFQSFLYFKYTKNNRKDIVIILVFMFFYLIKLEKMIIYSLQIYIVINLLKKYNFKKIFQSFEKISILGLLFIIFNYFLGISSPKVYYGIYDGILKNRNTYGIVTPNILFGIFLCYIIFASLNTNNTKKILFLLSLSTLVNNFIISRNGYYISIFYLLLIIIIKKINNFKRKILFIVLITFQMLFSNFLVFSKYIITNDKIYNFLNLKLSGRVDLYNMFLDKIQILSFFGVENVDFTLPLDNSYLVIFRNFGIIGILLVNILLVLVYLKIIRMQNNLTGKLFSFLFTAGIYYNFEAFLLNGGYLISIGYFLIIFKLLKYKKYLKWRGKNAKNISNNTCLQC